MDTEEKMMLTILENAKKLLNLNSPVLPGTFQKYVFMDKTEKEIGDLIIKMKEEKGLLEIYYPNNFYLQIKGLTPKGERALRERKI